MTPARSPAARPPGPAGLVVVGLLALGVAVVSSGAYALAGLDALAEDGAGLAAAYAVLPAFVQGALYVHIVSSSVALLVGPLQFSQRLRRRSLRTHRLLGRVYLGGVAVGAVSAVLMLPTNSAGVVGFFGFGALAVVWAVAAVRAYRSIRVGDVDSHRAWMIRTYALTFAAVTLRAWLGLLVAVQLPFAGAEPDVDAVFADAYAAVPFLCWLPNLVVAEWLVRRRGLPSYRLVPTPT
ncbi:DUF2306 domain-containing protein [Cellulomonas sp. JZ18]|uniref:DUF2306 domain-containing protein n=1 Tax=Cellulomonas sp. JZ18 TaxID=2654191 RepID=UPI001E38D77F|nr:DUF2306 domain-containing protein [Cellulomonas sp. JZ18]